MRPAFRNAIPVSTSLCLVLALLSSGCAWNGLSRETPSLKAEIVPGQTGAPAAPQAKVILEVHPDKGESKLVEQALQQPMSVQQMLVDSGMSKKFRRMNVDLVRPLPTGGYHKIALHFDRDSKRISTESDYALQPGDRLIIVEDTTTMLDDMIQKAGQPFGIHSPKRGRSGQGGTYFVEG